MKPELDRLRLNIRRKMQGTDGPGIGRTIFIQIIHLLRSLFDRLVDLVFVTFIYDEKKQYKPPKIKDPFIYESATSLADKIRRKELSAEAVVQAYIHRINSSNSIVFAMIDNRFKEAMQEAKDVDKMLSAGEYSVEELKKTKPFLGVPFTAKESIQCKGLSFTLGVVARKDVKGEFDADLVRHMREAGAILLGVTNVPELNLWCETRNMLHSPTLNPYNLYRTVGGSSGGEAALLAVCSTPLGIGTDIGGSIRMPAFFCGVFGHKPTTGITSLKGTTFRDGTEKTMCVAGPMTRKCEDLIPFLKVLASNNASKLRLDDPVDLKSMKVFYMEQSDDLRVSPVSSELKQGLRRVVNHLQDAVGKPATKLSLPDMQYTYRIWRYWMSKESHQFADVISTDGKQVSLFVEFPKKLYNGSDYSLAALLNLFDARVLPKEKAEWAEPVTERLRKQILDKLGDNGVLIFPSNPTTARNHNSPFLRPFNFAYFAIFNALQLPVTQVPIGLSEEGMPMGVQVVAAPFQDRLCLAVAKELENTFGGWTPPFPV